MKKKLTETPKNCQGCGDPFSSDKPMFIAIEWHAKRCGLCRVCHNAMEVNGKLELPVTASFRKDDYGRPIDNELWDLKIQLQKAREEKEKLLDEIKKAGF